jgi:hypothetical protein
MSDRNLLPGKFVWFELCTKDADRKRAQAFYGETLGWRAVPFAMGQDSYEMIYAGDTMQGGYASLADERQPAHWISYVSVKDVDGAARAATAHGGKVVKAPFDAPTVGRMARIADPQGAELYLFHSATGNAPDLETAPQGHFFWNELHTSDPTRALEFYDAVVGYSHRSMDMGPGGTYHILARDGKDRAGVTAHLAPGVPPHWLPYVSVDDPDATVARARKLGANIPMACENIPGVGRFGVMQDPTGAVLAIMKPLPRQK